MFYWVGFMNKKAVGISSNVSTPSVVRRPAAAEASPGNFIEIIWGLTPDLQSHKPRDLLLLF